MTDRRGASIGDYRAPLFLAWQITNRCRCRCLHCCEESGPDKAWPDELDRAEALRLARDTVALGVPYAAFGGGEPLSCPHVWEVFETLVGGGVGLKVETDGTLIDEAAADRLRDLHAGCVQISVEGATAAVHDRVRPGGDFRAAVKAMERLAARGIAPEFVFVPTRHNLGEAVSAFDLAVKVGARAFVTGPMMRLGRAAAAWEGLAPSERDWARAVEALKERSAAHGGKVALSVYPWDILTELSTRLESPQAMLLVVPNGKVKLLNALPFAPADLRRQSLAEAWEAYKAAWRSPEVRDFIGRVRLDPSLLRHANECWELSTPA